MNKLEIKKLIQERKMELFSLLCELIKINSENFSSYGNEADVAEYISKYLKDIGLSPDKYSPLDVPDFREHQDYLGGRGLENRYNVTVRWNGTENEDYLMLMAHSDTEVVGDPDNWSIPPLCGEIRDGKIWGRGACDDKYAIATAAFVIKLLKENGFVPRKNVLFTAYCDEEKGGGNGALASCLRYPAKRIINMDCKNFELWHCASGGQIVAYKYHTAEPVDSAYLAAKSISVIMDVVGRFGEKRKKELNNNQFYKDTIIPETALRYMGVKAGCDGSDLGSGEVSFNYYTDKTKDEIYAEFDELHESLKKELSQIGVVGEGFFPKTRFFHYGYIEPESNFIKEICASARDTSGRELAVCGSCLSDLSIVLKYGGGDAVAFGIGRSFGEYGGAHQPDEYIGCEELIEYAEIMTGYIIDILS